jgi:hypothetical protein
MLAMVWVSEACARLPGAFWWVAGPGTLCPYYGLLVAGAGSWFAKRRLRWSLGAARPALLIFGAGGRRAGRLDAGDPSVERRAGGVGGRARAEEICWWIGSLTGAAQVVVPFLHARRIAYQTL